MASTWYLVPTTRYQYPGTKYHIYQVHRALHNNQWKAEGGVSALNGVDLVLSLSRPI